MEILTGVVDFPPHGGSGPQVIRTPPFLFPGRVLQASAVLTAYVAEFSGGDNELGRLHVLLDTEVSNSAIAGQVVVRAMLGLRAKEWDNYYDGQIQFCLLVELEPRLEPIDAGPLVS